MPFLTANLKTSYAGDKAEDHNPVSCMFSCLGYFLSISHSLAAAVCQASPTTVCNDDKLQIRKASFTKTEIHYDQTQLTHFGRCRVYPQQLLKVNSKWCHNLFGLEWAQDHKVKWLHNFGKKIELSKCAAKEKLLNIPRNGFDRVFCWKVCQRLQLTCCKKGLRNNERTKSYSHVSWIYSYF